MAPGILQSSIFTWNRRLSRYVKAREYRKTLECFRQMQRESVNPDKFTFVPVLSACSRLQALEEGRDVHREITRSHFDSDIFVGNSLVDMYSKCGSIGEAWEVFNTMATHDVVSWNAIILGHVKCGEVQKAFDLFEQMRGEEVGPNAVTFVGLLNGCASIAALEEGRRVHEEIIRIDCEPNIFVCNCLIDMYAKCGSIEDAWRVFIEMPRRDVISWNAMILGCAKCDQGEKAFKLFQQMHDEGAEPDPATFVGVLNACTDLTALEEGRCIHEQIIRRGCESNVFLASGLIDMYAKCGSIEEARRVFNKMSKRDVVSWNAMIAGHVKCMQGQKALELFRHMYREGVEPDPVTFAGVLNACSSLLALEEGRLVHELVIQAGCESNLIVCSSLIEMYTKCGSIEDARKVFNNMPTRNVVVWSAMILGHVKCGEGQKALELYWQMHDERVEPNSVSFVGALNACASITALAEGRRVHQQIIQRGYESDPFVGNCLVDMYAKCRSIEDARKVFSQMRLRDVVCWSTMIRGCVRCGEGFEALELYRQMQQEGVDPDPVTFVAVLNACACIAALEDGCCVHEQIIHSGCESDFFVCNSLVDMYAKCGSIEEARKVFDKMPFHDVVSWSTMILGYVKGGEGHKALELYCNMQKDGVDPDTATFVALLNACATVGALEKGRDVHRQVIQSHCETDVLVGNSLVDMYTRCGSLEDASRVFDRMPARDGVSWNVMLRGYAMHGHANETLGHFEQMCQRDIEMSGVTFIALLSACSHSGLVDEGLQYFESISLVNNMQTTVEHIACLVDLLGRAGLLHEAEDLIKIVSCEASPTVWRALAGACIVHGNLEMGERIARQLLTLEPANSTGYVLLANLYSAAGKWDDSAVVKERNWGRPSRRTSSRLD